MTDVVAHAPASTPSTHAASAETIAWWVAELGTALASRNAPAIRELFGAAATVRDLLALSWDFRNAVGRDEIVALLSGPDATPPLTIEVRPGSTPLLADEDGRLTAAAFLRFTTATGSGDGYVKVATDDDGRWRAEAFVLALASLDSHPEQLDDNRPTGRAHGPKLNRVGWREDLDPEFTKQDPTAIIIGAGHNGLMLAARLRALGIPALTIERNERVGDNWRKRYSSLALHTPLASDGLPYIPYPPTWTRFTPKDKLADFLECYATLLDLPVWTGSRVENVRFDDDTQRWTLDVVRADGSRRAMATPHLVFATGMNGEPFLPDLPGMKDYRGTLIHAVDYRGHAEWAGKKAIVIGSGVSGHDLAQDLAEHGVDVTMIQRSGTVVMNTSTFHTVMHANHVSGQYTAEDADLVNSAVPFGLLPSYGAKQLELAHELDGDLLPALEKAGFELSEGPDGQGVLGLIFGQNSTGYYYNAGASELIADGTIKLRHGNVVAATPTGIALDDGTTLDADLVIFATGYRSPTVAVERLLGEKIARQLQEFANVSSDREYGRLWRRSGIDRLWFMISLGIGDGRFYSRLLALQIAAIEAGTMPLTESKALA
ncbi:flavin-containing monooxygenase [Pseudolysinimonas yzui]|uniref:FAD-dependent oxidoreductase n=1 Tax=Pseudolysinimonas yzui TaxID=2708254 RepID=A0A8J3GR23_9MICO|nr:NAD(P)/FAD-dependent oxidoreductase [Pseudolysinimonas yzui]GHF17738.1 FAD-dependent oxidoreductase [Pseudolysinimonas yzui]